MIKAIPSSERHHENFGWLDMRWHFSFDTYYDPANVNWGALRVFNDDVIAPGQGFGMHGHRDMEIVTYVLEGELGHRDNQGNRGVVRPGEVQVMSADTGIQHSEFNHSGDNPLHLLQLWILPRTKGSQPRWEERPFAPAERQGRLLPVVSFGQLPGTLAIDQDAQIYVSSLSASREVTHQSYPGRKAYLFVISGGVELNRIPLAAGDQARIAEETELRIRSPQDAELILLDFPELGR